METFQIAGGDVKDKGSSSPSKTCGPGILCIHCHSHIYLWDNALVLLLRSFIPLESVLPAELSKAESITKSMLHLEGLKRQQLYQRKVIRLE